MTNDGEVRQAVYRHLAATGGAPSVAETAAALGGDVAAVRAAYRRLADRRLLVLEPDGDTIRMAPPFSAVATQHRVEVGGREYYANCSWDAFGVVAALGAPGTVRSRCEQSREPLEIAVGPAGPAPLACVAHFAVPAAHWWDDIVFT